MRVLCLHGGEQSGEIFENQISKLCVALADIATFEFLNAPFVLPLKDARDDVQTRSWCSPSGDYAESDRLLDTRMRSAPADIMLGFSQGGIVICRYLMRHLAAAGGSAGDCPLPKGVVFAGTPDPREALAGSAVLKDYTAHVLPASGQPFFGSAVASFHLVGSRDAVVPPASSTVFARACAGTSVAGAAAAEAELFVHEHAHSFPQQQSVIAAVRNFCEAAVADPAELEELLATREMELEMVSAMYAPECGDSCVLRQPSRKATAAALSSASSAAVPTKHGEVLVTLPLLSPDAVETGSSTAAAAERALTHLSLRLRLPRRYPAVVPEVDIINGPAWHSVGFERWRADLILRCAEYITEDLGLGTAMILPVHLFASEQAQSDLDRLKELFSASSEDRRLADGGTGDEAAPASGAAAEWAAEDEAARVANIEEAERQAVQLLRQKPKATLSSGDGDAAAGKGAKDGTTADGESTTGTASSSASSRRGGSWTLTIGLIGKPSAGKSTFFNAVTNPQSPDEAARVAAFPFTTIEPNVGTGFGGLRCPCASLLPSGGERNAAGLRAGFDTCDAAYGHVTANGSPCYRQHPILVKDVAGLVQGAYQGKGKGNQFLNDLCDADVLVHVVDGAGATDADGTACPPGQGSTLSDITWVRSEVHSWVYDNLRAKWEPIRRTPAKLRTMFSGYRSSPLFVDRVLSYMGIANELALKTKVPTWGPQELHLLVALYTRQRFPMVVALNKADLPTAPSLSRELHERYPDEFFVPLSAKTEWDLLALRGKGLVRYLPGESTFEDISNGAVTAIAKEDAAALRRVHEFFDTTANAPRTAERPPALTSTGVQDVLAEALSRCAAVLVYPVSVFNPAIPSIKHCFSFKPGTTADDVFWAMTYAKLLDGKLVRFEVMSAGAASQPVAGSTPKPAYQRTEDAAAAPPVGAGAPMTLKKTDALPTRPVFVRVLSNKRQMS